MKLIRSLGLGSPYPRSVSIDLGLLLIRLATGIFLCTVFEKFLPRDGRWGPRRLCTSWRLFAAALLCVGLLFSRASAQVFDERFEDWPTDLKINGTIVVSEATHLPDACWRSLTRDPMVQTLMVLGNSSEFNSLASEYGERFEHVQCFANTSFAFDAPIDADVFLWRDDRAAHEIPEDVLHRAEETFRTHVLQGKTLVLLGPHAKALSRFYRRSINEDQLSIAKGIHMLPDCVLEIDYDATDTCREQVLGVLALHPKCVGIGLARDSALMLRGRKMSVFGPGGANILLADSDRQPARVQSISEPVAPRQDPERSLIDLTQWRREAIDRTLEPFPPVDPGIPRVEKGHLLIVGGGGLPAGHMKRFIEFAGGIEKAKLVFIPCEESDRVDPKPSMVKSWKALGVRHATSLHTKDRVQANTDEEFYAPLRDATGVWFGGGRQWNLADSYYGTKSHRLMKEVLQRGGVIGGSSAGASIQARYLARATPIQNFKIMAPGYERGGLGFLSGVAIDQHFSQRGRHPDMTQLVNRYPQLLGIGIDETTAITVEGSIATVSGAGKVHFYDRRQPVQPDQPDFIALEDGQAYDLAERVVVPTP